MAQREAEQDPLLPLTRGTTHTSNSRCRKTRCCIRSKAALLILLWNFTVLLGYKMFYDVSNVMQIGETSLAIVILYVPLSIIAIFAPIAGSLTDFKFSRYKAVVCSSYALLVELIASPLVITATGLMYTALHEKQANPATLLGVTLLCPLVFFGAFIVISTIFTINALQFGMDQLHDASTEDSILFIHWYVWICYVNSFFTSLAWNMAITDSHHITVSAITFSGWILFTLLLLFSIAILIISLCVCNRKKIWFLLEPASVNPYGLVYRVAKFAYQHKVPLRRSAFTYCEDEFPSRMDLGKHKYGGPFTSKQVEDVKAFSGILKVLICVGPAFMLQTVIQSILPAFAKHGILFIWNESHKNRTREHQVHIEGIIRHIFVSNGLLSPLFVVICIPLYLCLIRPHVSTHIPGILKRIGLGIVLMILSLSTSLAMDILVHRRNTIVKCMFGGYTDDYLEKVVIDYHTAPPPPLYQNVYFLTSQYLLSGIINILIDIGVYEFICSQSPYSMKGLLLGLLFSMKSLFQAIAIAAIIPFGLAWHIESLSCGSGFYVMNLVIGLLELALFTCMAKRYKYRKIDEPPTNVYRYAEDYYSNIP